MENITVIILTKNEGLNIAACIESAKTIAERVVVVDCGSVDKTIEIAKECGAHIYYHEWLGHAKQFNWALDNCHIKTEWVFRLDADERLSKELSEEISDIFNNNKQSVVDGFKMRWQIFFMGKRIKHGGTHKPYFLRLFRYGKGRVEDKLMDEHIIVNGKVAELKNDLIHYDYKGLDSWLSKHIWYSSLEIQEYSQGKNKASLNEEQRKKRGFYYKLPLFIRARLYYWYRYYLQLGFLDGKEGKIFCFLQAYWYRFLVDSKIYEMKKAKEHNG